VGLNKLGTPEARARTITAVDALASKQLRALLETKHLYQRVSFDPENEIKRIKGWLGTTENRGFWLFLLDLAKSPCTVEPRAHGVDSQTYIAGAIEPSYLEPGNVKLYCPACKEAEMFAQVDHQDLRLGNVRADYPDSHLGAPPPPVEQVQKFSLGYQCQRCHGETHLFLVKRQGWFLTLEGRSPMEKVVLPKYVPKPEAEFFRDAMIAMHGGKTLAALFYLRTFLEQFARRQTGAGDLKVTGDTLMEDYSSSLEAAQRDMMPSLKEWYGKLSAALHSATSDEALFEEARAAIEKHLEIRKVFNMREAPKA
jgi:ribosomal protein L44E